MDNWRYRNVNYYLKITIKNSLFFIINRDIIKLWQVK
jgi:hypothetical protein